MSDPRDGCTDAVHTYVALRDGHVYRTIHVYRIHMVMIFVTIRVSQVIEDLVNGIHYWQIVRVQVTHRQQRIRV